MFLAVVENLLELSVLLGILEDLLATVKLLVVVGLLEKGILLDVVMVSAGLENLLETFDFVGRVAVLGVGIDLLGMVLAGVENLPLGVLLGRLENLLESAKLSGLILVLE